MLCSVALSATITEPLDNKGWRILRGAIAQFTYVIIWNGCYITLHAMGGRLNTSRMHLGNVSCKETSTPMDNTQEWLAAYFA